MSQGISSRSDRLYLWSLFRIRSHPQDDNRRANGSIVPGQSTGVEYIAENNLQLPDKNSMFIQVKIGL